jgi:hypothetical protein
MTSMRFGQVGDIAPLAGKKTGVRWGRMLVVLLLVAALLAALWYWWSQREPDDLTNSYLDGPRGLGCERVVIASDDSGSMSDFFEAREQALSQVLAWAPDNLRPDDELAAVGFSGHTYTHVPPTQIADPINRGNRQPPSDGTSLSELLRTVAGMPRTPCSTSVVLLSDGKFHDLPGTADAARNQLRESGIDEVYLLVPGEGIEIEGKWSQLYPYATPVIFEGTDADATALVFGHTFADITGQQLRAR